MPLTLLRKNVARALSASATLTYPDALTLAANGRVTLLVSCWTDSAEIEEEIATRIRPKSDEEWSIVSRNVEA